MTNEQLAGFIKQGGNDELIPILWERIRNIMYMKSDKVYRAMRERFAQCGVEVWDLKQSCYTAFLKAIDGYKPETGNKFATYLEYPFRNTVSELLGYRTKKAQHEPLNDCVSLDMPVNNNEPDSDITYVETISDDNAVNAVEKVELADEYRILREVVDRLEYPRNVVIKAYYFEEKSMPKIAQEMGTNIERIRQIKAKALRGLRNNQTLIHLYREEYLHDRLNSMQKYQTRPDKHLNISELEENYKKLVAAFTPHAKK